MTYSDEQVITLLKESVPSVPEAPARVDSVRRLAARQRSFVGVQVVGAAASLVLVLAAVAAIARPMQKAGEVQPVDEPVRTMVSALLDERSFRFELTSTIDGPPGTQWGDGSKGSRATGVFSMDGTMRVAGTEPMLLGGGPSAESELRIVDGKSYTRAHEEDDLPPGKKWMRSSEPGFTAASIRSFFDGVRQHTTGVRYTGQGSVRGEPVATYAGTMSGAALGMGGGTLDVAFALDREGRPRRMSVTMPLPTQGVVASTSMALELYDFGTKVDVEAPPESEVVDDELGDIATEEFTTSVELSAPGSSNGEPMDPQEFVSSCAADAATSAEGFAACMTTYERMVGKGVTCTHQWESRSRWTFRCTDGTSGSRGR